MDLALNNLQRLICHKNQPTDQVLANQVKFLEPPRFCSVINCALTFHTTNVFDCFCGVMVQFKIIQHKILNYTILHVHHLCGFQNTYAVKKCMCQNIKYHDTTKNSRYLPQIGLVLWQINHCRLFNAKCSLYIYIKYIWFCLVWFYGKSTIVGYLMPNPLYTYILNIWFVAFGFMAYQPLLVI